MSFLKRLFDIRAQKCDIYTELRGRGCLFADGFGKLKTYTDTVIVLSSESADMRIRGVGLSMRHLSGGRIAIDGRIDGINYL